MALICNRGPIGRSLPSRDGTHRGRNLHTSGDEDLARRDLKAVNGTRNGRHCGGCEDIKGINVRR